MSVIGKVLFQGWACDVDLVKYNNSNRYAIQLYDANGGEPIARATVNVPEESLVAGHVFIKDYAENAGIKVVLTDAGIIEPTGKWIAVGYEQVEVCRLTWRT